MVFAVDGLEAETEHESYAAQSREDEHRGGVVVGQRVCNARICSRQHAPDDDREEVETDVLNPEDHRIGRAEHAAVHELRYAGPQRRGYQRERDTQQDDGRIGDQGRLRGGQDEREGGSRS